MHTPPPYHSHSAAPKKNHSLTYALLGVAGLCLVLCGVGGYYMFQFGKGFLGSLTPLIGCTMDLEDTRDALVKYAEANGQFPDGPNWQEDVKSYYLELRKASDIQSETKDSPIKIERMNPDGPWGCNLVSEGKPLKTGFAFNKALAGKKLLEVKSPTTTPLVFEVPTVKMNQVLPYAKPTEPALPKIMDESRDWMIGYVMGDIDSEFSSGNGRRKVSVDP